MTNDSKGGRIKLMMKTKTLADLTLKFHHMGVVVADLEKAEEHYKRLGFGPFKPSHLVHTDRKVHGKPADDTVNSLRVSRLATFGFELVSPVSGPSVQKEFLEQRGEGVNHICFIVDDIKEAIEIMAEAGFNPVSAALNEGGGGMAYFDTDKVGGLMLELDELPPHLSDDYYWGMCPWQATLP